MTKEKNKDRMKLVSFKDFTAAYDEMSDPENSEGRVCWNDIRNTLFGEENIMEDENESLTNIHANHVYHHFERNKLEKAARQLKKHGKDEEAKEMFDAAYRHGEISREYKSRYKHMVADYKKAGKPLDYPLSLNIKL